MYKDDFKETHRSGVRCYVDPVGRVITPEQYKQLKTRSESVVGGDKPTISATKPPTTATTKKVLSAQEAKELFEPFCAALKDFGRYADEGLWLMNPDAKDRYASQQGIWGNLTNDEAESLAKPLLSWGQRNQYVAVAVREAVHLKDYAALAGVLVPRISQTKQVVDSAPERKRRNIRLFRTVEGIA